jgi:uracil-DNA glycosylase
MWRLQLLEALPNVELTLLVGSYAQRWRLPESKGRSMTEIVAGWRAHLPGLICLPHPSWRNTGWLKRNPWFEDEVVPYLRMRMAEMLAS